MAGILLAFNKRNYNSNESEFLEFGMEDQRVAKLCSNIVSIFMAKINIYENSISEKNSINFYLSFADEIFKYVNLMKIIGLAKFIYVLRVSQKNNKHPF